MPDEIEVLGFELDFLTDTKVLEKLKKILGETFQNTKNLEEAIKALNKSAKGYNLKALTTQNEQLAKSYEKQKDNLLKLAKALGTKKTKQIALNNLNKKFGLNKEGVFDNKKQTEKYIPEGKLSSTTKFYKEGKIDPSKIKETYKTREVGQGQIFEKTTTVVDNELSKTVEKVKKPFIKLTDDILEVIKNEDNLKKATLKALDTGEIVYRKYYKQVKEEDGKRVTHDVVMQGENVVSSNKNYSDIPPIKEKPVEQEAKKDINKKIGKSNTSKFLSRVKNIVVYRLVRVAMSAITKGVNEGFELLSSNNSAYKDVINSLKASTTALSVTFAQLLLPIAESLSTALEGLTTRLIDSANAMALQQAMLNGEEKYFKLSKKSIDEYAKSLSNANKSLSQLDKFATLSQGKPLLGTWEDVSSATEKEIENTKNYSFILDTIKTTVESIAWAFEGIIWLISKISNLSETWKKILGVDITAALITIGMAVSPVLGIITSIITATNALKKVWDSDIPKAFKIATSSAIALAAVLAVITALLPGGKAKAVLALGTGAATAAALADYGIGSLFVPKEDTGSSQASYDSPLASGGALASNDQDLYNNVQMSRTVTTQTSTSDVYLDGNKVGKTLTKTVFSYGAKGGYV